MNLKIEYVPIGELSTYENNAKLHPAEQIEQIKESIQRFGFRDPIGIWNGTIVEGHGRYIAAQELGYERVPVIRLDDMSDEERKAYALVHNKLTMNTDFDFDALEAELEALENTDIDMSDFGFDVDEPGTEDRDISNDIKEGFSIIVDCKDENEQQMLYDDLIDKGYTCRLSTL